MDAIFSGEGIPPQVTASLYMELEVILKAAAELAESSCTRDHRQHTIISQSSALKTGLQSLMTMEDSEEGNRTEPLIMTRRYSATLKQEVSYKYSSLSLTHHWDVLVTCLLHDCPKRWKTTS